jgi:hypothetical protein
VILSLSGRAGLITGRKTGIACQKTDEKGFDTEAEKNIVITKTWLKILDKN